MKTGIRIGGPASAGADQFESTIRIAVEAEKLGVARERRCVSPILPTRSRSTSQP